MKIGLYVQTWHVGGVAAFCERLAGGFLRAGHSPFLILATPFGKRDQSGRAAFERLSGLFGSRVLCLHLNAFHPKERAWRAADQIVALNCEVIFLSAHMSVAGALPALSRSAGLIGLAHTDDNDSYAEFQATAPSCLAYVGVSAAITTRLEELKTCAPGVRVLHIPYGVPAPLPAEEPPEGPPRFLVVGRLVQRQKGVLDLPAIWREYNRLGGTGTLTICGPGEEELRLREEFSPEIGAGRVTLTGAVALEKMPGVYATHDVLVSVSAYEGLPLVVLEAASSGLFPVLSRTRSGHPEIIEALREGCLCEVGDIAGFGSTLRELDSRVARIRALRPVLRERAQAQFSLERMCDRYVRLAADTAQAQARAVAAGLGPLAPLTRSRVDPVRRWLRRWQYQRHYARSPQVHAAARAH